MGLSWDCVWTRGSLTLYRTRCTLKASTYLDVVFVGPRRNVYEELRTLFLKQAR